MYVWQNRAINSVIFHFDIKYRTIIFTFSMFFFQIYYFSDPAECCKLFILLTWGIHMKLNLIYTKCHTCHTFGAILCFSQLAAVWGKAFSGHVGKILWINNSNNSKTLVLKAVFHKQNNGVIDPKQWCDRSMKCGAISPVQTVHSAISPDTSTNDLIILPILSYSYPTLNNITIRSHKTRMIRFYRISWAKHP